VARRTQHEHVRGGERPFGGRLVVVGAPRRLARGGQGDVVALGGGGLRPRGALAGRRGSRWPAPWRPTKRPGNVLGAAAWGVFVATVVHKPADALTIVSLMLRAGVSRPLAHLVNLAFAAMIPLGVALFFLGIGRLGPEAAVAWTAAALAFSAGTFLCIALSDLLPELQFHAHDRTKLSLALLAGFGLMAATALAEPRESSPHAPASNHRRPSRLSPPPGTSRLGTWARPARPRSRGK